MGEKDAKRIAEGVNEVRAGCRCRCLCLCLACVVVRPLLLTAPVAANIHVSMCAVAPLSHPCARKLLPTIPPGALSLDPALSPLSRLPSPLSRLPSPLSRLPSPHSSRCCPPPQEYHDPLDDWSSRDTLLGLIPLIMAFALQVRVLVASC